MWIWLTSWAANFMTATNGAFSGTFKLFGSRRDEPWSARWNQREDQTLHFIRQRGIWSQCDLEGNFLRRSCRHLISVQYSSKNSSIFLLLLTLTRFIMQVIISLPPQMYLDHVHLSDALLQRLALYTTSTLAGVVAFQSFSSMVHCDDGSDQPFRQKEKVHW